MDTPVDLLRRAWLRLRFYLFRSRYDREMEEEMRHHMELRAAGLAREGMSQAEARQVALQRFGNRTVLQEERRSAVAIAWLETLGQDARYVLRSLRHSPGFATMVVLTLGLGIGANAAMFGIVDRLLLRGPEHVVDPKRVVRVYVTQPNAAGGEETRSQTGYVLYTALRDYARAFERVAAYSEYEVTTGRGPDASKLHVAQVTWDFFPLLGVRPALGRFFGPDEDKPPQGEKVVVLDAGYWERAFGADSSVLGRTLTISGLPYTIVGVAPKGFTGVGLERRDVWMPMSVRPQWASDWPTTWNATWLEIIGRLKPGVTPRLAGADATAAHRRAYAGSPEYSVARARLSVAPLRYTGEGKESTEVAISRWLVGVAAVVLLVACANAGNLALGRVLRRRREVAVHLALGISRGRLVRLLLAESVLLALAGGAAGLVLALVGGRFMRDVLLPSVSWTESPVNMRILAVTAVAALATGVLVGLVPAVQGSRPDLTTALKAGAREGGVQRSRLRSALTITQAALSVVLLVGAGLFVRSLSNIRALRIGIEPDRVLTIGAGWPSDAARSPEEAARLEVREKALYERALARFSQLPGIEHASLTIGSPFGSSYIVGLAVAGRRDSLPRLPGGGPWVSAVTSDYFRTVGTRVLRGRVFTPGDGPTSERVAVVNETMARTLWPGEDPIGHCLLLNNAPCSRVVGVVEDARRRQLVREEPAMQYYIPFGQEEGIGGMTLLVRPAGDAAKMIGTVRRELQQLEPAVGYIRVQTLQEVIDPQVRPWRLGATMFTAFGGLALLVAAIGIYSLVAYLVAQRTHELGIRVALGARAADIARLVMGRSVGAAAVGVAIGVGLALALGRLIEPLLFETSSHDAGVFLAVTVTLLACAVLASLVPTWRATRVDPVAALRVEN